jgi:hypothetical protein
MSEKMFKNLERLKDELNDDICEQFDLQYNHTYGVIFYDKERYDSSEDDYSDIAFSCVSQEFSIWFLTNDEFWNPVRVCSITEAENFIKKIEPFRQKLRQLDDWLEGK